MNCTGSGRRRRRRYLVWGWEPRWVRSFWYCSEHSWWYLSSILEMNTPARNQDTASDGMNFTTNRISWLRLERAKLVTRPSRVDARKYVVYSVFSRFIIRSIFILFFSLFMVNCYLRGSRLCFRFRYGGVIGNIDVVFLRRGLLLNLVNVYFKVTAMI